jgi:hypothetical protein
MRTPSALVTQCQGFVKVGVTGGWSPRAPPERRPQDSLPCLRERRKAKATMGIEAHPCGSCLPHERRAAGRNVTADPAEESKTMTVPRPRPGCPSSPGSWTRARSSRRSARSGCTCPPQLRPDHGRQHLTPAMARPAAPARAQRSAGPGKLRGQRGQRMPGTDTGAPPRKTSPGGRTFIAHGRNHARRRPSDRDHCHHAGSPTTQCRIPACSAYPHPPCRLLALLRWQICCRGAVQIGRFLGSLSPTSRWTSWRIGDESVSRWLDGVAPQPSLRRLGAGHRGPGRELKDEARRRRAGRRSCPLSSRNRRSSVQLP